MKSQDPYFTPPASGLEEYAGDWGATQVVHLLKRTTFGATPSDITYFSQLTMSKAVDILLQPTNNQSSAPLNNYGTDSTGIPLWSTWVNSALGVLDGDLQEKRTNSLLSWWMGRIHQQKRTIHEKMTLFWHNHFATHFFTNKEIQPQMWYRHYLVLHNNALGNFKQLVKEITIDPAMLFALNGNSNRKKAPNENYGRELQELYVIGKGPGSRYTEDDVRAVTRVLTGHTVSPTTYTYFFDAGEHDDQNKQLSAFYNNKVITGKSGANGATEVDELLTTLFATEESAKFICRKLYRFFIYYKIDDSIEENVITPLAIIFRSNNYNITPVLTALFKSQHFFDMAYSSACIIKSPIDFVVGLFNEFNITPASLTLQQQYDVWYFLFKKCAVLQQMIGGIEEVAGWYPYYLEPSFHELWINSVTYSLRNELTDKLIMSAINTGSIPLQIDVIGFASSLPSPADPNALIKDSLQILLRYPLDSKLISTIKQSILLSGQTTDYYWTTVWNACITGDPTAKDQVTSRLRTLYKYIMNLPEFQLC